MSISVASEIPLGNIQQQMRRMMDQMQKGFFNFCPSETWTPSVNLYESETSYLVCVDLSGVDKEKIEVAIVNNKLTLRGNRAVPVLQEQEGQPPRYRVHLMEIDHGPFSREVELPEDVEQAKVIANHRNGLLWIELPRIKR